MRRMDYMLVHLLIFWNLPETTCEPETKDHHVHNRGQTTISLSSEWLGNLSRKPNSFQEVGGSLYQDNGCSGITMDHLANASEETSQRDLRVRWTPASLIEDNSSLENKEIFLEILLNMMISKYLNDCHLVIIFDKTFENSQVLKIMVRLPNFIQVASIESLKEAPEQIDWRTQRCQGILLLVSSLESLLPLGNREPFSWDYTARVIVAGLTKKSLEMFVETRKARKTEHIIGIVKEKNKSGFDVYTNELFWGNRRLAYVFTWRGGVIPEKKDFFLDKISNLRRSALNILIFEWAPAVIYHRGPKGDLLQRYGRDITIIERLADKFNFTATYKEPHPDELFGWLLPNGSFSGVVGLLGRGEGDLAVANIWMNANGGRNRIQEHSTSYDVDYNCFLAWVDPPLPLWQSPSLPFQMATWLAILIGLVSSGPALHFLVATGNKNDQEYYNWKGFSTSVLYAFGAHFSQPFAGRPKTSATRVFVAFLWAYAIILTTAYRSNLIAFLTVSRQPKSIETAKELFEAGHKIVGIPFFGTYLKTSKNRYLRGLAERFEDVVGIDAQSKKTVAREAVVFEGKLVLEMAVEQVNPSSGKPLIRLMKECLNPYNVGVAMQKDSPLKPKFDIAISSMFEGGLMRRWFKDSMNHHRELKHLNGQEENFASRNESLRDTDTEGVIPLKLDHLGGAFMIWSFGVIASGILFTSEFLLY